MASLSRKMEEKIQWYKNIWADTVKLSDRYQSTDGEVITDIKDEDVQILNKTSLVKVLNSNPLVVAQYLSTRGIIPLIVNASSDRTPGGSVKKGVGYLEEEIFRRSNYHMSVNFDMYPLIDTKCIYSPQVMIFKDANYKVLKSNLYQAAFLAIPPVKRPPTMQIRKNNDTVEIYTDKYNEITMRNRINMMFKVAISKNHDCLVIPEFGCDYIHGNPVKTVIKMFNDAIKKYPIPYVFFAIDPMKNIVEKETQKNRKITRKNKVFLQFHNLIHRNNI
jgi:uncharacterized protein (TIGR02452 family)